MLRNAARDGSLDDLRQALALGADPRLLEPISQRTPLIEAALADATECVKELLPLSDPDAADEDGDTALFVAARRGKTETFFELLALSNPKIPNNDNDTPLIAAISGGNILCVNALIPLSDANAQGNNGRTALIQAAALGRAAFVKALIPFSDTSKVCFSLGNTALIEAASRGKRDCAELLLPVSDPHSKNLRGLNALEAAIANHHKSTAELIDACMRSLAERAQLHNALAKLTTGNPAGRPKL